MTCRRSLYRAALLSGDSRSRLVGASTRPGGRRIVITVSSDCNPSCSMAYSREGFST